MDIFRDHIDRILKIRHHADHAVSRHLEKSVVGGIELPEVLGVENRLNPWILSAQLPENGAGLVCGIIINKHQLIVVLRQLPCHGLHHSLADGSYILFLVVAGN